jgi:hypothetical protein
MQHVSDSDPDSNTQQPTYRAEQGRAGEAAPESRDQSSLLEDSALEFEVQLLGLVAPMSLRDRAVFPLGNALVGPQLLAVDPQALELNCERCCLLAQLFQLVLSERPGEWLALRSQLMSNFTLRLAFLRVRRRRDPNARRCSRWS